VKPLPAPGEIGLGDAAAGVVGQREVARDQRLAGDMRHRAAGENEGAPSERAAGDEGERRRGRPGGPAERT